MTEKHLTDQLLDGLPLSPLLLLGLREAGFARCTPIQAEALPVALAGQDVAGQAQTGTGKTAAFLLAAFNHLLARPEPAGRRTNQPRALVLAPTRELAIQIHHDAGLLGRHTGIRLGLAYGGTGYDRQRRELQAGVDLLIGTPGRLIDYLRQGVFDLEAVQVAVLDEADRMFDLGFIKDVRYLMRRMPPPDRRLNMLFSATLSHRVMELAYEHMNNPQVIKVQANRVTVEGVQERVYFPANDEKVPLLLSLLHTGDARRTLVFVNTRHAAGHLEGLLRASGLTCGVLSGDVPQTQRERLLQAFKDGDIAVLVATDVAARGLHIPDVSHVINFDLPQDAEDYVHRIGRTARAGASGDAISMACERYAFSLPEIEAYLGRSIPVAHIEPGLLATVAVPAAPRRSARFSPSPRDERQRGSQRQRPERTAPDPIPTHAPAMAVQVVVPVEVPAPAAAGDDLATDTESRPPHRRRRRGGQRNATELHEPPPAAIPVHGDEAPWHAGAPAADQGPEPSPPEAVDRGHPTAPVRRRQAREVPAVG